MNRAQLVSAGSVFSVTAGVPFWGASLPLDSFMMFYSDSLWLWT